MDIALDVERGMMYWTDIGEIVGTAKIQRANLDGSNVEDLITTGLSRPVGIALDVGCEKVYWTDYGTRKIQRANLDGLIIEEDQRLSANLDGSIVEDLITRTSSNPVGIALDVERGMMYWMDIKEIVGTAKIQRANLDGSNVEDLIIRTSSNPVGIALDVERGKMYWTDRGTDKIQRANIPR